LLVVAVLHSPSIWVVVAILGATGWMGVSRLVRGQFLTLKEQDFTTAARALGIPSRRIMFRHILPNASAPILVNATLIVGGTILTLSLAANAAWAVSSLVARKAATAPIGDRGDEMPAGSSGASMAPASRMPVEPPANSTAGTSSASGLPAEPSNVPSARPAMP